MSDATNKENSVSDRTTLVAGPLPLAPGLREAFVHYLVITEGLEPGRIIELGSDALTIGRVPPCDVVLRDVEISRSHCRVERVGEDVLVRDLQSTNGTFVDGQRLDGTASLPLGGLLQVGRQILRYERRSRRELEQSQQFDRSLERASQYIFSLLPPPLTEGRIRTEWLLLPSTRLGGDAFGYHALDDDTFALYLLDVSGHGAEAAMLAVAVMNFLRQRAMPGTDFSQPAQVIARLNTMFQMDSAASMFFTMWYGVFRASRRELSFSCGGHHPAYLVPASRNTMVALRTPGIAVGAMPDCKFTDQTVEVPPGSSLYVFSDGVFEIVTAEGRRCELEDFLPLLLEPRVPGMAEPQRLYQSVHRVARRGPLEDDFSLLVATFA